MSKNERLIYRILFIQQDELKELYSQYISEETLVGFIEADTLLVHDSSGQWVVESTEVKRCYIPLHTIVRIDEIILDGPLKKSAGASNVSHLPRAFKKSTIAGQK